MDYNVITFSTFKLIYDVFTLGVIKSVFGKATLLRLGFTLLVKVNLFHVSKILKTVKDSMERHEKLVIIYTLAVFYLINCL